MRKPRRGVCGRCGHAVVAGVDSKIRGWSHTSGSWSSPYDYGHERDDAGRLVRVRCERCASSVR